jgi:hypothetical protein
MARARLAGVIRGESVRVAPNSEPADTRSRASVSGSLDARLRRAHVCIAG